MTSLARLVASFTLLLPALGADAAAPVSSPEPALSFRVERGGDPIGTHEISFRREGEELHVSIDIRLAVTFGPITVFRYEHRNRETWRGGRLVALETTTNDDGTAYWVRARATEKGLEVTSSANGTFMAPAGIIPTSYWNPATVTQTQLLDTQKGRIVEVSIAPVGETSVKAEGREIAARIYDMTGDLKLRLTYSQNMEWLNVAFMARGSEVDYVVERIDRAGLRMAAK
ncbi:MAG: DUF6134 family protein [Parvibaculum sp.]